MSPHSGKDYVDRWRLSRVHLIALCTDETLKRQGKDCGLKFESELLCKVKALSQENPDCPWSIPKMIDWALSSTPHVAKISPPRAKLPGETSAIHAPSQTRVHRAIEGDE